VNWRQAASVAVRLVRQAQAAGLSGERIEGVRRTIVQRLELIDPATGRPAPD
jgi:hypothetical protein